MITRPKFTALQLSGVHIPAGSDMDISESLRLIGAAADLRRTVNGDAVNLSRTSFRKYTLSIKASDMWAAGLAGLTPGDYLEAIPSEPLSITTGGTSRVDLPRAGIEIIGITADDRKVVPANPPAAPLPLQKVKTSARIASLRSPATVFMPEPVQLVRFRPVLACIVVNWSSDADERMATASWALELEEI